MDLPDLKSLDKLIALCRKRGVKEVCLGELKLTLGDEVPESTYKKKSKVKEAEASVDALQDPEELTYEQKLMWSVQGPILPKSSGDNQ